jgi:hypothetical protein
MHAFGGKLKGKYSQRRITQNRNSTDTIIIRHA